MKKPAVDEFDCVNHNAIHDNIITGKSQNVKEKVYKPYSPCEDHTKSPAPIPGEEALKAIDIDDALISEIRGTVKNQAIAHILEHEWDKAIKCIKFLREVEALIPRPTGVTTS